MPDFTVVVPAGEDLDYLRARLPAVVAAARAAGSTAPVVVVRPPGTLPLELDGILSLVAPRPGKVPALRTGIEAATTEAVLLLDADVELLGDALSTVVDGLGSADLVAGSVTFATAGPGRIAALLHGWALASERVWLELRRCRPDLDWAIQGPIVALRRDLYPEQLAVESIDDLSLGLALRTHARLRVDSGARVRTAAPGRLRDWTRQKLRARRGWLRLRAFHPVEMRELEAALRALYRDGVERAPLHRLLLAQDAVLATIARITQRRSETHSAAWRSPPRDLWRGPETR